MNFLWVASKGDVQQSRKEDDTGSCIGNHSSEYMGNSPLEGGNLASGEVGKREYQCKDDKYLSLISLGPPESGRKDML